MASKYMWPFSFQSTKFKDIWLKFSLGKVKRETMCPADCPLRVSDLRGSPCLSAGLFVIMLRFVFHSS